MSREERQKELLFRWVQFSLSRDEPIKELAEFQDGSLLTSLMEVLAKKKAPYRIQKGKNKLTVIGNLQNTLKFIEAQRVRVTCSPNELYDLNENMLFGLLWVLILKYQVQQKANILAWAALLTEKPLSKHARARVKDFDASWQDGLAFALLVNAIEPRTIDVSAIGADNRNGLVRASFDAAKGLGIPQLLNVDDSKFDERGILTYLSYFYNKYSHVLPQDEPDPELELLRAKVMELMTRVTEAESKLRETEETSQQLIIKTTNDLRELMEQQEDMQSQLEESKEFTQTVNKKIQELTLKMPFYNNSGQSATPPPKGEVTLVFTDVQSSTDQWEKRPDAMAESLRLHNEIMREIIGEYKGYEVKTEGDAFMIAFASSENAVNWCLETQQRLMTVDWPEAIYEGDPAKPEQDEDGKEIYRGLRVRMGVHTGKPKAARDPVNGRMDYFGPMVNRSARVEGSANGGQIILSGETWDSIQEPLKEGAFGDVVTKDLGNHRLKGLQTDTRLMQILPAGLATRTFPDIKSPEAEEKANLEKQFEALQMNNKELKVRFVTLEEEAQEAMKKAAEFQKWLHEQGDKFPKSLADELAIMGNNVKTLMRSQRNLMKELLRAQERAEISDAEMHGLKERLEQSLDTEGDLRKKLIEVTEECDTLDSSCTSYRTKLAELEKLLSSKDKPKGILRKLGVGGNKDKTIVAATTLLKSEETPEEVKTEVQSRRKSRHLAVGDMANLMEALEAQEAAEADGAEAGEEGAETAEKQGKNEPEEAEKSRDKKEGKKDVKKDAKKQYSKKDLNEQKEAAPAPAPAPEAGQDAKKANMKKRTSMKFVGKVLSRKKPADADANEDKAAKKERAAGEKAAKKEKADEEKAARKEKAEGEKAAKKEKADDNKAVKKEKSAKNDSKQSKADSAEDASEERRALSEEEPEKKDKKEKKEKKEKKSKKEKKEKKKDNEESEQDNSVEEKEKMERREEKDEGSEKSGEEASVELNTDKKKAKKEKKGSHEKEGSAEEEDKKKKDKESEETDDKKDEKDEKKGKKKGKKKDKKDKEGSEEDEKVDKEKEDKEDKKHKHKHKKKEKHKKEGKDGEAEDEDD